ncbi:tyrosine-type recombinase/integrase [Paenibacillus sp. MZ04-78.2]|uniref:tyrosine-type recombinase/integrase n=1 Tax=Paenibacillus sp. MZ04-78.2 TaxID=2962034 RepID=UPI0020B6C4F8|nr:tyrosine-type recombinase/integrase [Paenibacillus sp. MZ04-78.2]MCP3776562.1 tyrosine-type recombinase/integrase [Paenibacillus sp. MZ04-78.2]
MPYIQAFEAHLRSKDRSENTISCYLRDTSQFTAWYRGKTEYGLERLIELDGVEYKKHLQSTDQAVITINRKIASINVFCQWMYKQGYIKEAIHIEAVRDKTVRQYKGLEDSHLWKLRNEIHRFGNRMHICMIEILIGTGIRVSELVGIRLQDIELSERKGTLKVYGKGNSFRTIPINKDVRKAITRYLEVRPENDSEYLFIGQRGALERNAINLILNKYGDRIHVKVTPHMLRHTLGYKRERQILTTFQEPQAHEKMKVS